MDNKYIALSIATAIIVLLAGGYTIDKYMDNDPEPTHKCVDTGKLKYCDRLSNTQMTCYPSSDSGVKKGYKRCSSLWELIIPIETVSTSELKGSTAPLNSRKSGGSCISVIPGEEELCY